MEWEGVFGVGGGIWNGRGYLEKNSTAMNENSGVLKNSCDRIFSYEWCYKPYFTQITLLQLFMTGSPLLLNK